MADVVDLIMADHREVERLFEVLESQPDQRPIVLPVVTALLVAHSRAEEAEVYPIARDEAGKTEEVSHSQEEHAEAEQLLQRLRETPADQPEFETALRELVDAVSHHVHEEESSVLPGMRERLSEQRRAELGEAFARARAQHLGEMPGEATREEFLLQAKNAGISGADSMTKDQLRSNLRS